MWGGKTKKTCNRCSQVTRKQMERNVYAPARALTASAAERGMPLLDLFRTEEEKKRIVAGIFSSDAFRALRPEDSVIPFAMVRARFEDVFKKVDDLGWTEAALSFRERGAGGSASPVLRVFRGGAPACITGTELKTVAHIEWLFLGDRIPQGSGGSHVGAIEGLITKAIVDAGTPLAEQGGGRLLAKSQTARGCAEIDKEGLPLRGR